MKKYKENTIKQIKQAENKTKQQIGNGKFKEKATQNKMRKKINSKFIFICISRFLLVSIFVGIIVLFPIAKNLYDQNQDLFTEKFFGKKSEFQGILRLWNIDSFEGGSFPKNYFLEKMSEQFEKKFKGVYIMVQNMTEDEVVSSIKAGTYPDIVTFGTGLNKYFNGKFMRLDDGIALNILPNFYSAGLQNGSLMAVPFMVGAYTLISSTERIERANKNPKEKLSTLAFALATDVQKKKTMVHTNSITFGGGEYTSALNAFSRKFKNESVFELAESGVVDINYNKQSAYQAYENFVLNKSNMLLGTQRDVFRMQNRVLVQKELDAIYEPISEYTDLVQYVGVLAGEKVKYTICSEFIKFILEEKSQKQLSQIGMFSVLGKSIYESSPLADVEKIINDRIIVKSTF